MPDPAPITSPAISPCPECGGECVRAQTVLGSFGVQGTSAYLTGVTALYAVVCSHCGLTRFYAADPAAVLPKRS
jgi:predicted nucleic-acid-binding Zn-ribbon protein